METNTIPKAYLTKWTGKPRILINAPDLAIKLVDEITSYKIKGAEHIPNDIFTCDKCGWWKLKIKAQSDICPYCNTPTNSGHWDYMIRLLSKTQKGRHWFPVGLLETVENTLTDAGYETHLSGWPVRPYNGRKNLDLSWQGHDLRTHQIEAMDKAMTKLMTGRGTVIEMPTGSGKTTLAMKIIQEIGVNTLILVHKKNLLNQWKENIINTLNIEPALFGEGHHDIGPIEIGIVQSVINDGIPLNMYDMIIVDECHHTPADQTYKTLMKSDAFYRIGLSATPIREDGNELKMFAAIGTMISGITNTDKLIKKELLAKPEVRLYNAPYAGTGSTFAEARMNQIVMNTRRHELIKKLTLELVEKGYSVLITVDQIPHGKMLESMIQNSKFIHGKTPNKTRDYEIKRFEQKSLQILISTLLNEGSDIPSMDAIIISSGGKSIPALVQKVGRALRTTDTKKNAIIIDILDQGKWLRDHAQGRVLAYNTMFGGKK